MENKIYFAIDLKSFYASCECVERNLDPLTTNLLVADIERTDKTICLAVSPSLKSLGIKGRPRLYEVVSKVSNLNRNRKRALRGENFTDSSYDIKKINGDERVKIEYIVAKPQMRKYIEVSSEIYGIYLDWFSKEDIHVYSIDEVFIDATNYLNTYGMKPKDLIERVILDVFNRTGITATGGFGTNLYLAKVAMDIMAKKKKANANGVRISYLDEYRYRKELWDHLPITDFWRVGKGYEKRLKKLNLKTMGDICRQSLVDEDVIYDAFGINGELLIDHAWGYEPCTIEDIKGYVPENESLCSGQVLHEPYTYGKARIVLKEMVDSHTMDLVLKGKLCDQITIRIGYDRENVKEDSYRGDLKVDGYGRLIPKHSRGTINLDFHSQSTKILMEKSLILFDRIVNRDLTIRKISISFNHIIDSNSRGNLELREQLSLFNNRDEDFELDLKREKSLQKTVIDIKKRYGKNSILRGMNFEEGATQIERNSEIGGHRA